jgi:hypothetical protein
VFCATGVNMNSDDSPSALSRIIDPAHLLQAIENSLQHSGETEHGVTGVTFKSYTITVRRKKDLCWSIECKFKPVPAETKQGRHIRRSRRRLEHDDNTKDDSSQDRLNQP